MKILITGFAPFGGQSINPSYEAVKTLPEQIGKAEIIKAEVPVVFGKAGEVLAALMDQYRPDAVICVGQAGGREGISLERVAINVMGTRTPDNEGKQQVGSPVVPGGPAAYFSTLPLRRILDTLLKKEIPCEISNSAGTYVCNDLMYRLLHRVAGDMPAGFIHVPYLPSQTASFAGEVPCMELGMIVEALKTAVEVISSSDSSCE